MKKSVILFAAVILLMVLIFKIAVKSSNEELTFIESRITGSAVSEDAETETSEPEPVTETPEPVITILDDIEIELPEAEAPGIISDVNCIDNRIELLLTNPTNRTLALGEDIIIHLNGMIVVDPECRIYSIMPKKKVFCSDISGHLAIRKGKKNSLQLSMDSEKFDFIIDCENQI